MMKRVILGWSFVVLGLLAQACQSDSAELRAVPEPQAQIDEANSIVAAEPDRSFRPADQSSLPSRDAYRAYDFEADPWLSAFNQTYAAAKADNAAWLQEPQAIALRLAGYPNPDGCEPTALSTLSPDVSRRVLLITSDSRQQPEQCSGDSVEAAEIRVDLVQQGQHWTIDWAGGRYRCRLGRGQQSFAPTLCN